MSNLRERIPQAQFQNWLEPISLVRANDSTIVIGVPSKFHLDWINNNYSLKLKEVLEHQTGTPVQLEFEILKSHAPETPSEETPAPVLRLVPPPLLEEELPKKDRSHLPALMGAIYDGTFNQFAFRCAQLFSQEKSPRINPLVIVAGVGMGKTQFLSYIGKIVEQSHPDLQVRYISAESFTNEMIQSFHSNKVLEFKKKYGERTQCLLCDDVEGLARRIKTQEILLHIFNEILARGGRIAFTARIAPGKFEGFIEPLRSRLLAGVITEIQTPSPEERFQLLAAHCAESGIDTEESALRNLATNGPGDLRELIGTLLRLHLKSSLENLPLDSQFLVREGVRAQPMAQRAATTLEEIIFLVEQTFGISRSLLVSKSRKQSVTWARHVAMYLARLHTLLPLEEIGKVFGRDHATVIHSFARVAETMERNPSRRYEIEYLQKKLGKPSDKNS